MRCGERPDDLGGRVARPVVDDDDLERCGQRRQLGERFFEERADVLRLVVGGEDTTQ
jgi:hypothetical protein